MPAPPATPPSGAPLAGPGPRVPPSAWIRPVAVLLGGAAAAALLVLLDQLVVAVPVGVAGVFMAWWTSPLRRGPHTPLAEALGRRADDVAIILWAPGDPLSSRLQTAVRGTRPDVIWVNVHHDPAAVRFAELHGGRASLPLTVVGDVVEVRTTAGRFLDLQAEGRTRAAGTGTGTGTGTPDHPTP